MITAADLRPLRRAAPDYKQTEEIKARLKHLRQTRSPFCLGQDDLEPIFRWKLRGQYGRQEKVRSSNTDEVYRAVTQAVFAVEDMDWEYEVGVRFGLLTALKGIGVPVASAILALAEPERYCVIDFRGWRAVFGQDKRYFLVSDYKKYFGRIGELAAELGWPPQEVDHAVWEYDQRNSGKSEEIE